MSAAAGRALQVTRAAAIGVAVGAVVTPPLANIAAGVMLIAFFFVSDWRARVERVRGSRLAKGVLVFVCALVLAAVLGAFGPQGPAGAFKHLLGWRTLAVLLIAFAVFDDERAKVRLMVVFIALAAAGGLAALATIIADAPIKRFPTGVVLRNTVTQAMAFGIAAFFAVLLLLTRRPAPRWQCLLLVLVALLLLGLLIFLQVGRSGQVMFAVLVLVAALRVLRGPRRVLAVAAIPALAVAAFALSPVIQSRFSLAWQEVGNAASATEYSSMGIRVVMWQNSVELARARPVVGYGLGGLEPAYAALVKDQPASWKSIVTGDPHNQFLAVWIEGGLAGLLAFVFFLVCVATQPAPEPWRTMALSLLAAWCATSMVSSHFQTFNEGHLIMLFLGALLAPSRSQAGGETERGRDLVDSGAR